MTRAVVLTERRTVERRLRRADADDLARHFRGVVAVTPTFERGVYRLTARGYVGRFRTANVAWEVRPKLPWDGLAWLAGARPADASTTPTPTDWGAALADLLAGRLAGLLRERAEAGLLRDYAERETTGAAVRGRIDFPRQLGDRAHSPARFHLVTDEFTPDVVWNRAPKAAARRLLAVPGLSAEARAGLANAVTALAEVADVEPATDELDRLRYDRRTEAYRPLVALSRLVLAQPGPPPGSADSLLVNLEHLFQLHVAGLLARPGVLPRGWSAEPQAPLPLDAAAGEFAPLTLFPDLLVRGPSGEPRSVWDSKWKPLTAAGPDPADVHQVLGYAAALGLRRAGLVYPGRKFAAGTYRAPGSGVILRVVRLRLAGPAGLRERAAARFARAVCAGGD